MIAVLLLHAMVLICAWVGFLLSNPLFMLYICVLFVVPLSVYVFRRDICYVLYDRRCFRF